MARHMKNLSNNVKECTYYYGNELYDGSMCWPPRCYTCNFCKREFKSAQALGGHMNVHRRDRAKFLMMSHHSPPTTTTNDKYRYSLVNLNTNPNISSSSAPPPTTNDKYRYSLVSLNTNPNISSSSAPPTTTNDKYRYSLVNLNTNPNISSSSAPPPPSPPSSSRKIFSHYYSSDSHEIMRKYWGKGVVVSNLKSSTTAKGSFCMQDKEYVRFDLEIGLFKESKQDLDLELRLGYI